MASIRNAVFAALITLSSSGTANESSSELQKPKDRSTVKVGYPLNMKKNYPATIDFRRGPYSLIHEGYKMNPISYLGDDGKIETIVYGVSCKDGTGAELLGIIDIYDDKVVHYLKDNDNTFKVEGDYESLDQVPLQNKVPICAIPKKRL